MKKIIFFFTFFVFISTSAQDIYNISGRIVDDIGEGIPQAIVSILFSEKEGVLTQVVTDIDGNFSAKGAKNNIRIVVFASGFKPYEESPFLWDKNINLPNIVMQPSVNQLSGVVVSASKKTPAIRLEEGKIIFSPEQNVTISGENALETLKKTPGVLVDNSNNISILGKRGAVVFINGKSTYMQNDDLANFLKTIPVSQIKNIEIMLNPSAQYDAEGSAGIINIVLTKQNIEGTYLSVGSGVSYWKHLRNNTDISLQHNTNKLIINAGYSHQWGHLELDYGSTRFQDNKKIISSSEDTDKRKFISGNFGISYIPNDKNTIGLNLTANTAFGNGDIRTQNTIYSVDNQLERTLYAVSDYFSQKANRYGANIFYETQPTENQKYNIDLDYVFFDGGTGTLQPNSHKLPSGNIISDETYLTYNLRKIHIFALAFHQKLTLGNGKWNSGVKFSQVSSKNRFDFYTKTIPNDVLDANRSNKFDYQENLLAIYAQYHYPITEKLSVEAGIRSEFTFPIGKLTPYQGSLQQYQENGENYANLFPSASLLYQKNEKTSYSVSYSSRIARPVYQDLNPFSYPLDGLSSWKGNPFLLPQKISKIGLNATLGRTSAVISYTHTDDFTAQITENIQNNAVLMTPKNVGSQKYISASVFQEILVTKGYKFRVNPTIFYINNNISLEKYPHFALKRYSFSINSQHEFQLPFQIKGNISTDFYSKRINAANEIAKSTGFVDLGLQRSFLSEKLNISISFTDFFHTNRWDNESHLPNLSNYGWGHLESRQVKFYLTYKIGKQKSITDHQSDLDETERL